MRVMSKITLRQMLLNKRRTIVTIIGVIISVAMFTAVSTLSGSFQNFLQRAEIMSSGNYHAEFIGVSSDDLESIRQDDNTKSLYAIHDEGLAQLPEQFGAKHFLQVKAISVDGMEAASVNVTEGRLPQNDQEIVISQNLKDKDGDYYKIGDTITLTMGERQAVSSSGDGDTAYMAYMGTEETFKETGKKTYTVVGFASMLPHEPSWAPLYTAVTGLNTDVLYHKTLDAYVQVNNVDRTIYDWIDEMQEKTGAESASAHTALLMSSGVDSNTDFTATMYTLVGILFVIIFIGSVALIYNAFAISVSERSVNFGLLASIGATKRQKLRSVLFEALLILVVAVPLGIIGGLLGIWGVFEAVNPAVRSLMSDSYEIGVVGLQVTVSPWAILVAVVLSILTTLISAWIPAKRASRISPMEAIRQAKDIKLTARAVKTSPLTRVLFGFEGEIAAKNMKRNKKRYRIAISSFVISLVLFLSASSFTHFLTASSRMAVDDVDYDVMVGPVAGGQLDVTDAERQERLEAAILAMRQMDGVEKFASMYEWGQMTKRGDSHITEEFRRLAKTDEVEDSDWSCVLRFFAVDDETLREYCKRVGADYDAMQDTENPSAILINDMVWQNGRDYTNFSAYDLKKGDMLDYSYYDYVDESNKAASIRLEAVTGEGVTGMGNRRYLGSDFVVVIISEKVYREYCMVLDHREEYRQQLSYGDAEPEAIETPIIYITASNPSALADDIEEMNYDAAYRGIFFNTFDITSEKRIIEQTLFLINTFSYVFIALISAIGVANIFNTISTSIILRKREFAMLKSVGMTPGSFNKMLFFESLLYGLKSLLWGLPISFAMMGLIYWALGESFHMAFTVPWIQVVIGIAAIFAIVMMTVLYAAKKVKKENIIEGLRNTNL